MTVASLPYVHGPLSLWPPSILDFGRVIAVGPEIWCLPSAYITIRWCTALHSL